MCFQRDLAGSGLIDNQTSTQPEPVCGPPASATAEERHDFWLHADDLFSTTSVTDSGGEVVERYDYYDYGFPLILDPDGQPAGVNAQGLYASKVGNPYLFTGREWDAESKLYHYRTRAYHPGLGRFLQIDRIGVWGDWRNLGGAFAYCASAPEVWLDPWGLQAWYDTVLFATTDFLTGAADTVTLGATEAIRSRLDLPDGTDYQSNSYLAGIATGTAVAVAGAVVGVTEVAAGVAAAVQGGTAAAAALSGGGAAVVAASSTTAAAGVAQAAGGAAAVGLGNVIASGGHTKITQFQSRGSGTGGGKNASHAGQGAKDAAARNAENLLREIEEFRKTMRGTKGFKKTLEDMYRRYRHLFNKARNAGEHHSQRAKGPGGRGC